MGGPALKGPDSAGRTAPSGNLGRLAFGFLAVCAVSGFALVPFYSPERALDSLERIQGGLPWGFLLRAIHAFSGFGLLVATIGHLLQVIASRSERQLSRGMWWLSVLLLPLAVVALLGGFVLRADPEAVAAFAVWRRILQEIPLVGTELARLTLGSLGDLGAVALHHAGTFTILLWIFTAAHGSRTLPDRRSVILAVLISAALAGVLPLPLGSSASSGASSRLLRGPWYLLGLQGALVDLPAAVGWLGPLLLILLVGFLRDVPDRARRVLVALMGTWVIVYIGFTVRLLLLARR